MRRVVIHLTAAFLGFFAGLLAHGLWPAPTTHMETDEPTTVNFCELARNSERYDGKLVRVRAELYKDMSPFIYDWSCGPPDSRTSPRIEIHDTYKQVLPGWAVTKMIYCANAIQNFEAGGAGRTNAEVVVTGVFQANRFAPGAPPDARFPGITAESISETQTPSEER